MMSNVTKGNIGSNNHNMILLKVDVECYLIQMSLPFTSIKNHKQRVTSEITGSQ